MSPGRGGLAVGDRGLEVTGGRGQGRQAHQSVEDLCSSGVRAGSVGADDLEHAVIGDRLGEGGSITVEQVLLEAGDEEVLRTVSAGIGTGEGHDDQRSRICAGAASPGRGRRTGNQAGPDRGRAREGPVRAREGPVRARRESDMARAVPAPFRAPARLSSSSGGDQKPMPPIPPMPSMPAAASAPAAAFSGLSATTDSVVRNRPAIEAAFCRAERVTLTGSLMPAASRSSYPPVTALRPNPGSRLATLSATTPASRPAFVAICFSGASTATLTMLAPVASSPSSARSAKAALPAWIRETPPPATIPSSTAALALRTASSMRCLVSLSSTSVAAPALMTATPPA